MCIGEDLMELGYTPARLVGAMYKEYPKGVTVSVRPRDNRIVKFTDATKQSEQILCNGEADLLKKILLIEHQEANSAK